MACLDPETQSYMVHGAKFEAPRAFSFDMHGHSQQGGLGGVVGWAVECEIGIRHEIVCVQTFPRGSCSPDELPSKKPLPSEPETISDRSANRDFQYRASEQTSGAAFLSVMSFES